MALHNKNSIKVKTKLTFRNLALITSIATLLLLTGIVIFQLKNPQLVYADTCESSYTLDWSNPATYSVTCGSVNSSQWNVKGSTCTYTSPVFYAGGVSGQPNKQADIAFRINQGGNLEGNDTCWVYLLVNGVTIRTFVIGGDTTNGVFSSAYTLIVPADGNYQVKVKFKNDKSNESWYLKNGDVTACLKIAPLPLTLGNFKAIAEEKRTRLSWITFTEINNDYFTVERSDNGTDFIPVENIPGAGNSNSNLKYQYYDNAPLTGVSYYRLRQTDFDGKYSFSHVITVSPGAPKNLKDLKVYPNPFMENFTVEFDGQDESDYNIQLLTPQGKVVFEKTTPAIASLNTVYCEVQQRFNKGPFLVRVLEGNEIVGSTKLWHK